MAKLIQKTVGFCRLGGPSWHNFLLFFGCLFQDRFLIALGSVLGSILELGSQMGSMLRGLGGAFSKGFW